METKNNQRKRSIIDEKKFKAVKMLLKSGTEWKEVADYLDIGVSTVGRINAAETFEEYKNMLAAMAMRRKTPAPAPAPEPVPAPAPVVQIQPAPQIQDEKYPGGTISANYRINKMYEMMKEQTEYLKLISNKLAFIVDELTGVKPAKEG